METFKRERLLVLTKTYPQPSAKHREVTCVAALTSTGEMRRLFPIPFRFLGGAQQFAKWEWIQARVIQTSKDQRPESRKIDLDSITRTGERIGTKNEWQERRAWIEPHVIPDFEAIERRRQSSGETLGFIRPSRILSLDIEEDPHPQWTEEELIKLQQDGLFDTVEARKKPLLNKIPFGFYYRYEIDTPNGIQSYRHKITDWEIGALYWNCRKRYGSGWESAIRQRLEKDFATRELAFLMGTIHRFPDRWLIVGLVYPPVLKPDFQKSQQLGLWV